MKATPPMRFAGSELADSRHVCAFFHNDDEEYRVLLPFIKDGFECGDRAVHVVNPHQPSAHLQRLVNAGIDLKAAEESGQFELRVNSEACLREGRFDLERMLEVFEKLASGNAPGKFPRSRIVCHMEWAVDAGSPVDQVLEFEARANEVWCRHEDAVICTYNLAKFDGAAVIDIIRTHPMVIIGGVLQVNPFFVPAEQFLRELHGRRIRRTAGRSATM